MGFSPTKESCTPRVNNFKKELNLLKEITKDGIEKLIKAGYIKNTGKGYVNPKRKNEYGKPMRIGYYKTCGGHRYIEDWYADKAKNLK